MAEQYPLTPFADDAPSSMKAELIARFDELSHLEQEQVALGTTAPNTYGSLSKFVANPSTVSVETYQRMIDTDELIGSGIDFMNLALISKWGAYKHPCEKIEKFVNRAIEQMEGDWHTNLDEMLSAEWAGFSCTEMVWKWCEDFDGAPAFVPKKLVTYHPLTIAFAVDPWGELLPDGVWQYQRYHNQFMSTGMAYRQSNNDLDGFRPDLFAARGDYPYPVRIAADVSLLTTRIPTSKILHLTSSSTGKFRSPYGKSILRRVYKNWVMKDAFLKMWLVAADRKGTPLVVGYAPPNDTILQEDYGGTQYVGGPAVPDGRGAGARPMRADEALADVLDKVHNSSYIVIPGKKADGFEIDSVQVQGDMTIFSQGIEYFNKAIMRGLLIPPLVMTGGDGAGSYALGESHKQIFREIMDSKLKVYKQSVKNQFIRQIIAYNFPRDLWEKEGLGDFVVEDYDPDVMDKLANVFDRLCTTGFMSPSDQEDLDHVRSRFGLPPKKVEDLEGVDGPVSDGLDPDPSDDEQIDAAPSADESDGDGDVITESQDERTNRFMDERRKMQLSAADKFEEKKHPRAKDGKFGSGGGGAKVESGDSSKSKAPKSSSQTTGASEDQPDIKGKPKVAPSGSHQDDIDQSIMVLMGQIKSDSAFVNFEKKFTKACRTTKPVSLSPEEARKVYTAHKMNFESDPDLEKMHRTKKDKRGGEVSDPSIIFRFGEKLYAIDGQHRLNRAIDRGVDASAIILDGKDYEKYGISEKRFETRENRESESNK